MTQWSDIFGSTCPPVTLKTPVIWATPLQAWPRCTHNDYLAPVVHPEDLLILSVVPVNAFFYYLIDQNEQKKPQLNFYQSLHELSGYDPKPKADNMIMNVIDYTICRRMLGVFAINSHWGRWRTPSLHSCFPCLFAIAILHPRVCTVLQGLTCFWFTESTLLIISHNINI